MPLLLTVLTAAVGLTGLVLGAMTVRAWNPDNDPDYLRDVVQHGVVAFLKLGLLLLLLTLGTVAVVGSVVAHRSATAVPQGVWVSAVVAWVLAVAFIAHFIRLRARR